MTLEPSAAGARTGLERALPGTSRSTQLLCAWSGLAATVLAALGMIVVGGFVPAQAPSASAADIAAWYAGHTTSIRIGLVLTLLGFTLLLPFGVAVALQTRRSEARPVMALLQIASAAVGVLEGVLTTVFWAVASFRPTDVDPGITRTLNDLGWFTFLFNVSTFTVWLAAVAIAILRDPLPVPVFPRWCGYLNVWAALLFMPGVLIVFFKSGPFGFNGLFALYVPAGVFFGWILVMLPMLIKAIKTEQPG